MADFFLEGYPLPDINAGAQSIYRPKSIDVTEIRAGSGHVGINISTDYYYSDCKVKVSPANCFPGQLSEVNEIENFGYVLVAYPESVLNLISEEASVSVTVELVKDYNGLHYFSPAGRDSETLTVSNSDFKILSTGFINQDGQPLRSFLPGESVFFEAQIRARNSVLQPNQEYNYRFAMSALFSSGDSQLIDISKTLSADDFVENIGKIRIPVTVCPGMASVDTFKVAAGCDFHFSNGSYPYTWETILIGKPQYAVTLSYTAYASPWDTVPLPKDTPLKVGNMVKVMANVTGQDRDRLRLSLNSEIKLDLGLFRYNGINVWNGYGETAFVIGESGPVVGGKNISLYAAWNEDVSGSSVVFQSNSVIIPEVLASEQYSAEQLYVSIEDYSNSGGGCIMFNGYGGRYGRGKVAYRISPADRFEDGVLSEISNNTGTLIVDFDKVDDADVYISMLLKGTNIDPFEVNVTLDRYGRTEDGKVDKTHEYYMLPSEEVFDVTFAAKDIEVKIVDAQDRPLRVFVPGETAYQVITVRDPNEEPVDVRLSIYSDNGCEEYLETEILSQDDGDIYYGTRISKFNNGVAVKKVPIKFSEKMPHDVDNCEIYFYYDNDDNDEEFVDSYEIDVARKNKQGQLSVKADKSVVKPGETVKFTVTLSGSLPKGDVVSYEIYSNYSESDNILGVESLSGEITIPKNWNGTTPLTHEFELTATEDMDDESVLIPFLLSQNFEFHAYPREDDWIILPVFDPVMICLDTMSAPKPEVSIPYSALSFTEGTPASIAVQLNAKTEKAVTIPVRITDGGVSKTVNAQFKPGEYKTTITFIPSILKKNRFVDVLIPPGADYSLEKTYDSEGYYEVKNRAMIEVRSSVPSSMKYVKNGGSNANDGNSFASAYAAIDEALRQVDEGGTVFVAGGTYPITKTLKVDNVSVYGGFAGTETSPDTTKRLLSGTDPWSFKHPAVITAAAHNASVSEDKYIRHITLGGNSLLNGFTLSGGKGPIGGFDEWMGRFWYGAASVEVEDEFLSGSHELSQCVIEQNEAVGSGKIIALGWDGLMRNCLVQNNIGRFYFAGTVIDGCRMMNNQAPFAPEDGDDLQTSMVFLFGSVIRNTVIANNIMDNMENPVVRLMVAEFYGEDDSDISSMMENCVVVNNTGYSAVEIVGSQINHSTIAHNLTYTDEDTVPASAVSGFYYGDEGIENSVITGSTADLRSAVDEGLITYSALEYASDTNHNIDISSDSWFVSPTSFAGADTRRTTEVLNADWSQLHGSPLIDAANGVSSPTLDMLGNPRVNLVKNPSGVKDGNGMYPDMGAYETAKKSEINLAVSTLTVSKQSVNPEEIITAGLTVANTGTVAVNQNVNTRFWLTNGTATEEISTVTARISLTAGDTAVIPGFSITVPSATDGKWTLWAELNAGPSRPVNETDYADNRVSTLISISAPALNGEIDLPPGGEMPGKPLPGDNLKGTLLTFAGTGFTVYAGIDYIPTSKEYHYKSRDAGGKQELIIPAGIDLSTVYLRVVNNTNKRITITIGPAEDLYFSVYSVNPLIFPNDRTTQVILNGNLLSMNDMNIILSQPGGMEVVGKIISVSSSGESATVSFNAMGLPAGNDYRLTCISKGRNYTFDAEVSGNLKPYIEGSLTGLPSFTPVPQLFSGVVRYKNSGGIETVAPTFILSVSGDAAIGLTRHAMGASVKFTGDGAVKNILGKGESGTKNFLVNNLGNEEFVVVTLERIDEKGNYVLVDRQSVSVLVSKDPNEISGPVGFGTDSYVMPGAEMPYTVRFENDPDSAFGPVKYIKVTYKLPDQLDIDSISHGNIVVADQLVDSLLTLGAGKTFYAPLESDTRYGCQIRIETSVDNASRLVTWQMTAVDSEKVPLTENTNPELFGLGLLQPNRTPPEGDGHFEFKVSVRNDTSLVNSWIDASATIWFDRNDPIETNIWKNRISGALPTPVKPLSPVDNGRLSYTASTVSWHPSEAATHYDVKIWKENDPEPVLPSKTGLKSTLYTVDLDMATAYCWQVTAWNQYDSAIGDVWHFTTTEPPKTPLLVSPANQAENISLYDLKLKASTVGSGATNYRFQLADSHVFNPEHIIYVQDTSYMEITLPDGFLKAGKTYWWRTFQVTDEGISLPSEPWTFKTVQGDLKVVLSAANVPCQGGKVEMTVKNVGKAPLDWAAAADRADVKLSAVAGTLATNDTASVIMTFPENTDYADKLCRITVTSPNALHSPYILDIKQSRSAGNSVSAGMISVLNVSDIGQGITEFTKKPSIRGIYTDAMNKSGKKASFKVMKGFVNGDKSVSFELTSNILLYNKKLLQSDYYKRGRGVDSFLKDGNQHDKTLTLEYKGTTNAGKTDGWESLSGTMVVKAPMISEIFMQNNSADSGSIMGSAKTVIRGMYAGKKFPKVWIEYVKNNKIAKLNLKVDAKDSGCYKDSNGKAVCTDPQSGLSYLVVTGPRKLPADMVSGGLYWLVIDNGSGLACERVTVKMP